MIAGATYTLPLDIGYPVQNTDKIIITLKNESTGIKRTKRYPNDEETRLLEDGRIGARLTQQDTVDLVGYVKVEAQINLKSGSVAKTTTERTFISPTLNTEMVVGAADNGENLLDGVTLKLGAPITVVVEGSEGTSFQPGNALEMKDGILNVLTTDDAEQGNNLPITSEGARKIVKNISYNDLTDRPFYEETEAILLDSVSFIDGYEFLHDINLNLIEGQTYQVVVDGEEHECIAKRVENHLVLGNASLDFSDVENTGETFLVVDYGPYQTCVCHQESNTTHTISVIGGKLQKLDKRFIDYSIHKYFYAKQNRIYRDIDLSEEIAYFESDWHENIRNGSMCFVYDTDDDWHMYLITGVYDKKIYCGNKVFYTEGERE